MTIWLTEDPYEVKVKGGLGIRKNPNRSGNCGCLTEYSSKRLWLLPELKNLGVSPFHGPPRRKRGTSCKGGYPQWTIYTISLNEVSLYTNFRDDRIKVHLSRFDETSLYVCVRLCVGGVCVTLISIIS